MKVLVTGGAGYVGSACLRYMLANGHEAIAYDNLSQGHAAAVPGGADGGNVVHGDILDTAAMVDLMRRFKPDAVMHFAAATYVAESVKDPEFHYRNNVAGTLSLLNAMREAGVNKLLFSSTAATYGTPEKMPITEETTQAPVNPYGRSKLAVEWMIRDFAKSYGMGYTLLRYFNAAGADADGNHGEAHRLENHLIPLVLRVPLGQSPYVQVFGDDYETSDGSCLRDYVHTSDLARAHLMAIEAMTPETGEAYNLGTGNGHTVLEVIRACEEVVGQKIPMKIAGRRPGDPPALVADPGRIMRTLGWKPEFTDIRAIVESAWKWHKSHPNGYGDQ